MVSASLMLADSNRAMVRDLFLTIALGGFFWGQVGTCILVRRAGVKGEDLVIGQSPFVLIGVTVAVVFRLLK